MRKTNEQIFEEIGLTREGVIAAAAGREPPKPERVEPRIVPRRLCPVCKKPINALNCAPIHYK